MSPSLLEQEKTNETIKKEINDNGENSNESSDNLEKKSNKIQEEGTVIDFYNSIFVPNLQSYVMKFSPNELVLLFNVFGIYF